MQQQVLFVMGSRACVREDPLLAAQRLGLRSTVFTPRPPRCDAILDLLDHVDHIDVRQPEQAVALACRLHEQSPVSGVLGYEEDATLVAAHIADALGLPAHPVAAAEAAMDKPTMKRLFVAAGVPCADFIVAADEDEAIAWAAANGYPVVVKPCRGGASQGVIRADDEQSLRAAYRRLRRIIRDHELDNGDRPASAQLVERYLPGSEVSCELLLQSGSAEVVAEFGKPLPLTGPYFEETIYLTPPTLEPQVRKEIHDLAIAAAKSLGFYHGPAHCEIRLTPDGPKVLEIAGRLLGGACARSYRDRLGQDIHTFLLRVALGERVTMPVPAADAPTVGALMMPVPGEGRVVAVRGADRARRVPGVWDVSLMAEPGEIVVPFPEQACYAVGFVSASGPDEAAVVDSLSWAAASITLELAPLRPDRWIRPIAEPDLELAGIEAVQVSDLPDEAVTRDLAKILFEELPEAEALSAAEGTLAEVQRAAGTPCWVAIAGVGLLLGRISGPVGHIGPGGVLPAARSRSAYEAMIRALLAEFAQRQVSRCEIELDPRLAERADALAALGFTRQPTLAPQPGTTRVTSCALIESAAEEVDADAGRGCCSG